jgi:protein SCO1
VKRIMFFMALLMTSPALAQKPVTEIIKEIGIDQKLNARLPLEAEFRDEAGKTVRLGDYFGKKPVILTLVYYKCPMLCPMTLNGLLSALKTLRFSAGKEFDMVTVSFDATETAQLAAEKKEYYVNHYGRAGAEKGWAFLTGNEASVQALLQATGFRYAADQRGEFAHASGAIVVTPEGKISRYFYGIEYGPKDLRLALLEAARGKIGNLADQILLLCYHYDPLTGRYGLAVKNILRGLGALTVLALAAFVLTSLRREKSGLAPRS